MFRQKLSLNSPLTEPNNTIIILTGHQNAKNENNFVTVQGGVKWPVALTLWAKIAINYPEGELQEFRYRPVLRGEVWGLVLAGK